jgi:calcium-dependent protein kinase
MQGATLMYMMTHILAKERNKELEKAFMAMDANLDGKLSRKELIEGYAKVCKDKAKAADEVDKIMREVDLNRDGFLTYYGSYLD